MKWVRWGESERAREREKGINPLPGRSTLRMPEGPSDTPTACHEWLVICTNFRTNKSTCQRKETWKGRCPAAQLKCNCCSWWNSVGWRITAVKKKRLHQIWQLAGLLFQPARCLAQPLAFPPSLCTFLFFTRPLSVAKHKMRVTWTPQNWHEKYYLFSAQQEIFSKVPCLFSLTAEHSLKGDELNHIARSCFAFPLRSGSIFLLLWSSPGLWPVRDIFTAAPWQL